MKFLSLSSWLNEQYSNSVTVLFPGGFKPLHFGHISLIKRYASLSNVNKIIVLIGPGTRNNITQSDATYIAHLLLDKIDKVIIEPVKYPSPVLTAYKYIETTKPGNYTLAASDKGEDAEDYKRVLKFIENLNPGGKNYDIVPDGVNVIELPVNIKPHYYKGRTDNNEGKPISASVLRNDVINNDYENFKTNYPGYSDIILKNIWNILINVVTNEDYDSLFYEQLNEEAITPKLNTHMTHVEDLIFLSGIEGFKWAISMFNELYEKLKSDTDKNKISVSVKFDGAPAVFVWSEFPGLQKYGIAIKGLFAKNRKIMYNNDDIKQYYGDKVDMVRKLNLLLQYLPTLDIPKNEIWQGDFLFDRESLINKDENVLFQPNTIVYKVNKNSDIGEKILNSDIGVVWHTRYKGSSIDDIEAEYNAKVINLSENPKVFMTDPYIVSMAGYVTLTNNESEKIEQYLLQLEGFLKTLSGSKLYNNIVNNTELIEIFNIFQNSLIRNNEKINDEKEYLERYIHFVNNRFEKNIESKKTEKSKNLLRLRLENIINTINENKETFIQLIHIMFILTTLKTIFIKKLNNIGKFETYLQTKEGKYLDTGQEGFAVSDIRGNVVKLVDRYEFSYANFSPDIIKGWS